MCNPKHHEKSGVAPTGVGRRWGNAGGRRAHWPANLRRAYVQRDYKIKGPLRCIFDVYSDPRYRHKPIEEAIKYANELNQLHKLANYKKSEALYVITENDWNEVITQINRDINLLRACNMVYADWQLHLNLPRHIDRLMDEIDKTESGKSLTDLVKSTYNLILQVNKEYASLFKDKLEEVRRKAKEGPRLPEKMLPDLERFR